MGAGDTCVEIFREDFLDEMPIEQNSKDEKMVSPVVDQGLISYFLNLSPEQRLRSNDNAIRTIMELRNAFKQPTTDRR